MDRRLPLLNVRSTAGTVVVFAFAYVGCALLGLQTVTQPENFALVWPPNGLLLGALLLAAPTTRMGLLATAGLGSIVMNLLAGQPPAVSAGFAFINVAEPAFIAWLLRRLRPNTFRLESAWEVFALSAVTVGVCILSGSAGGLVSQFGLDSPAFFASATAFALSDATALIVLAPLFLAWKGWNPRSIRQISWRRQVEAVLIATALVWISLRIFDQDPVAAPAHRIVFPFPMIPFLLWAAVRFGLRGCTAAILVVASIVIWHTAQGRGPFCAPHVPPSQRLLLAQLLLSVLSVTVIALGAALEERSRILEQLHESKNLYRLVTETIQDVFWLATPQFDRFEYVSPACETVWQCSREQALAAPQLLLDSIDAHDRSMLPAQILSGATQFDMEHQFVRGDGALRWMRTRAFPVRDETDQIVRIVGVSRDVTLRKNAELANVRLIGELQQALAEIKTLRGLVPICAWCKNIRDDEGFWQRLEDYLCEHTEARFTHGICPTCLRKETTLLLPDV